MVDIANLDNLGSAGSEDCIDFADTIVVVVRIVGVVAVELPVPCIGPDGFPPVEIYCVGIPDFAQQWVPVLVVVVVALVRLLRVPSRVVSVLEPTELPFAFSNPANIPWRRFYWND